MMSELVILGSSIVTPPNSRHHHSQPRSKLTRPKISLPKLQPPPPPSPSSSPPVSTVDSRSPLLSSVRWDLSTDCDSQRLEYCADLASKLAENGRLDDFAMVVETVMTSGVETSKFVAALSLELISKGVLLHLREGKFQSFVDVLRKFEKLGVSPLKVLDGSAMELLGKECRQMVNGGEVEEVVDLMEILAGFHFSIKGLVDPSSIVKFCVSRSDPNLAIRYACVLPHAHIVFCTIMHEFGRKGDLDSALKVYEASKQRLSGPNMYIYRTIIDVCGLCDDYIKSRYIYEDLLHEKVTPNIYVFNSLMNVNAHDLSYTFHVYKKMQTLGVPADLPSYNILLKACCLAGRVDLAQEIYAEVKEKKSGGLLKLDVFTYSTIIKVFADAKLWKMALKIKEDMLLAGVTPNTVTWSSLISACANVGLPEQAIKLFEEMLLAGCKPNTQCCNILLHACVEACQYDRAFRLFYSWKGSKVLGNKAEDCSSSRHKLSAEDAHKQHITVTTRSGSSSHHLSFIKKFPFAPTTATYNILMKACGTDYYRAKSLMDEMKAQGLSSNHISWSILMDICGSSGNVEGAMQMLKTMTMAGIKPDVVAYTTAIKVCVDSKSLKLAFSLFAEMKRCRIQPNLKEDNYDALQVILCKDSYYAFQEQLNMKPWKNNYMPAPDSSWFPKPMLVGAVGVTYNTLLRARSRYGSLQEVQQCLAIYQDMRKAGYKSNDYYLKELIEEWCEGVIQEKNHNQGWVISCKRAELGRPQSLLLERVATHLQKSISESLAIDLQGLTKVEARIVVLAVLRMIKENYTPGDLVRDDLLIILGSGKVDACPAKQDSEVKDAIVKLLRYELGLEVLPESPLDLDQKFGEMVERKGSSTGFQCSARRPVTLERLKVRNNSLYHWLHRRNN